MLSNTAVPYYYGEFRRKVLDGEIRVNREISMEMNRIDSLIKNPNIYYDRSKVEAFILFCENEMTLTDGSDLKLLDSFKLWSEQLFGWYYFVEKSVYTPGEGRKPGRYVKKRIKKRLITKQFLIVARGAAKSLYHSLVQTYELVVNQSTTNQVVVAPTMRLADEIMAPIRTAILRSKGPLFSFLTQGSLQNTTGSKTNRPKLAATKKGIEHFITGSLIEVRPMSIDKLQGLKPACCSVDEWLSGVIREDPIGALEQGMSKVEGSMLIATSSEGTVRNGSGDTIKMELMQILKGDYIAPHVSIFWYKLDDVSEIADPDTWVKANPNIGITVSYEAYQQDVERAEKNPSARNDIIAKRFGIPMEGYTYFFTYEETLVSSPREYWQMPCSMGIDLSQGDDFCAFTFLFPLKDGSFGIKCKSFVTTRTIMHLQAALRIKYESFINEGSLIVLEGSILDLDQVYDFVDKYIVDNEYDVRCVGYDPYNAKTFIERWTQENSAFGLEKVIQGAKTESVPLGELKILAEDNQLHFDQDLMSFCMGNAVTIVDTNGNRKLLKQRNDEKIDNVSALMDAYVAFKSNTDAFA